MVKTQNGITDMELAAADAEAQSLIDDLDAMEDAETSDNPNRLTMRRLRDVVRYGLGWETSAVTPQPFTDNYEFSVKSNTGNVYKVTSVKTFANMITTQAWVDDCENNPSLKEDADVRSRFYEQFGHYPSPKQFDFFKVEGKYTPAK